MSRKKLGEFYATAICGNDITSSVLYVSALAIAFAGQYAWLTLIIVAFILFLYRKIYGEVVGALPLNGGAYNALLNTTSKSTASLAATLTILSYMATAVISANEAIHYLHGIFPSVMIIFSTIVLLGIFAFLTIMGITESAKVAGGIFIFHLASLVILTLFIFTYLFKNGFSQFAENWRLPMEGSIANAIFIGFAVSMLGISGFESSANFVEEQRSGVFPKTLKNMWIIVSIINPLMAFLALSILPVNLIRSEYSTVLLSKMGEMASGEWLATLISIDAVLVLSGAVLTSFVGVSGLLQRISLDRVLPGFFLKKNNRGSSYRIILAFFILSVSILIIARGEVAILAGVYTISFLSVMLLFAFGNVLLKLRRAKLPRPEIAKWPAVVIAIAGVSLALWGNIILEPEKPGIPSNLSVFLEYFIPAFIIISIMLNRVEILHAILHILKYIFGNNRNWFKPLVRIINKLINDINAQQFVYFTKRGKIEYINQVILYVLKNEHAKNVKIVHVKSQSTENDEKFLKKFKKTISIMSEQYPDVNIQYEIIDGEFGPSLIKKLSREWKVPVNFMFIASPSSNFSYKIQQMGGVRLII